MFAGHQDMVLDFVENKVTLEGLEGVKSAFDLCYPTYVYVKRRFDPFSVIGHTNKRVGDRIGSAIRFSDPLHLGIHITMPESSAIYFLPP